MGAYVGSMSFGLGHGRELDDALGVVGVSEVELPPLPDAAMTDPEAGRVDVGAWFRNPQAPLELEIGSGKGTFLLGQGKASPHVNLLGIEWAREFYLYAADRVRRAGLTNVRLLRTDATEFLRWRVRDGSVGVIHLYFSDPWPKTKHHKNRVIQHRFLFEAWRVLKAGGELRVVTDHDELWAWDQAHFDVWTRGGGLTAAGVLTETQRAKLPARPFEAKAFTPPEWVGDGAVVGTNYERKMCVDRPPHALVLVK